MLKSTDIFRTNKLAAIAAALIAVALLAPADFAQRRTTKSKKVKPAAKSVVRSVPVNTEMKIRLNDAINSKEAKDGDRFSAAVLTPSNYADATVEGHIARVEESGKLKGRTSISFAFDVIRFKNGGSSAMAAQVVKVYGEDSAKKVDEEGNVESGSKTDTTVKRTGGGAAAGALIGAIAGGGKGAAIGAAIGAGVGAGSTYIQGSKKVTLDAGTEILIKTTR